MIQTVSSPLKEQVILEDFIEASKKRLNWARNYVGMACEDLTAEITRLANHFCWSRHWYDNQLTSTYSVGLASSVENSLLQNRIVFPIYDAFGIPVGIIGRKLLDDDSPKFLYNTGVSKNWHLWGLAQNWREIRTKNVTILTESLFDVMALTRIGWGIGIAMLGSTISHTQAALLLRYTSRILYIPHKDKIREVQTILDFLQEHGFEAKAWIPETYYNETAITDFDELAAMGSPEVAYSEVYSRGLTQWLEPPHVEKWWHRLWKA